MTPSQKTPNSYEDYYKNPNLRKRNLGILIGLVCLIVLFYAITMVKLL